MSDIFTRLAARATGQALTRAQPRAVPFESGSAEPSVGAPEADVLPGRARAALAQRRESAAAHADHPLDADITRAHPPGTVQPPDPDPTSPAGDAGSGAPPVPANDDDRSAPARAADTAQQLVAALARHLSPAPAPAGAAGPGEGMRSGPLAGLDDGRPRPASMPTGRSVRAPEAAPEPAPPHEVRGAPADPSPEPAARTRPAPALAGRPEPPAPIEPQKPDPADPSDWPVLSAGPWNTPSAAPVPGQTPMAIRPATRTMTGDDLLREHLGPALARLGAITEAERQALRPAPASGRSSPNLAGRIASGLDAVQAPETAEVHVHIGRVEITRPEPAPASAAPPRTPRPPPDHSAYLARQQRRWRQ